MTVERRTICPACQYPLDGLPGVPAGVAAAFKDDVACPECGGVIASGTRLLVGGASPFAMIRGRALYARLILELAFGRGCLTAILHLVAAWGAWYLSSASIDLLSGGQRYAGGFRGFGLVVAVASVLGVVLFWWRRRRPSMHHGVRASECDRWLAVAPTGVRDGFRVLSPSEVRTIEVFECFGAGDGLVAVSVGAIGVTEAGVSTRTPSVHLALPQATAHRLRDDLMATLAGRVTPAESVGDEIPGITDLPRFRRRVFTVFVLWLSPIVIGFALTWLGIIGALAVAFGIASLLPITESGRMVSHVVWRPKPSSVVVMHRSALAGPLRPGQQAAILEIGREHASGGFSELRLRSSHGLPYLELRARGILRRNLRIVPNDWLGIDPARFAGEVAVRIGIPFRDARSARA